MSSSSQSASASSLPQQVRDNLNKLARASWIALLVRGILALLFGILVFASPQVAGLTLVAIIGLYFLVDGIFSIVLSIDLHQYVSGWGWWLAGGIISTLAGIIVLLNPSEAILPLLFALGFVAIFGGVFIAISSFSWKSAGVSGWYWGLIGGIVQVAFGVAVLGINPEITSTVLLTVLGVFGFVFGLVWIIQAFALRSDINDVKNTAGDIENQVKSAFGISS